MHQKFIVKKQKILFRIHTYIEVTAYFNPGMKLGLTNVRKYIQ